MPQNSISLVTNLKPDAEMSRIADAEVNCGVILTQDGSFRLFQNGIDSSAMTEDQIAMSRKLTALAVALSNEQLMAILYDVMDNTEVLSLLPEEDHVQ